MPPVVVSRIYKGVTRDVIYDKAEQLEVTRDLGLSVTRRRGQLTNGQTI